MLIKRHEVDVAQLSPGFQQLDEGPTVSPFPMPCFISQNSGWRVKKGLLTRKMEEDGVRNLYKAVFGRGNGEQNGSHCAVALVPQNSRIQ